MESKQAIIYVGIDVSKDELVVAYPSDGTWKKEKVANDVSSIGAWLVESGTVDKHFVFEATGPYSERLRHVLSQADVPFSMVNPVQSRAMSKALLKSNKTDDQDAQALSLLGQKLGVKPYVAPKPEQMARKAAFSALVSLQKQERQLLNQIHAFEYRVESTTTPIKALQAVLDTVQFQIAELEKELSPGQDEEDANHCIELMESIKSIGKATAKVFVSLFGDFKNFDNAKQVAKFIGIAPREFTSGKSVRGRSNITKNGNSKVRAMLFNCARSAIRFNKQCKELYDRLIAKGKSGKVALVAVMHKLIRQVFGVVTSGIKYDPNFEKNIKTLA